MAPQSLLHHPVICLPHFTAQVATCLLKRLGVEVARTAADGLEAVSAVREESAAFDIIFMGAILLGT